MNFTVVIEGQNIPVPEEIGANDEAVKRALTPFYPEIANAMITRVAKDDTTTINVVKRAGSKGNAVDALIAVPGGKNPAIVLYEELQAIEHNRGLDPAQLLAMDGRIDQALEEGQRQANRLDGAFNRLARAAARPAPVVIRGF